MSDEPQSEEVGVDPHLVYLTGGIVTWWAGCEYIMWGDILKLLGRYPELKDIPEFQVIQFASKRKIKQWRRMHERIFAERPDIVKEVKAIAVEAGEISEDRNVIVHGMWDMFGNTSATAVTIRHVEPPQKDGTQLMKKYEVTEAQMLEVGTRAFNLYNRLVQLDMNLSFSFGGKVAWTIKGRDA